MESKSDLPRRVIPYRWVICALLFIATTCNYVDRQILGILAPTLQREIGWSELEYGYIVTAFQAAYAIGLLGCGWFIDKVGTKWGLSLAVALWSIACAAHGLASSVTHFAIARFGLGLAEAGNFPASIKSVAEWFPKRERAFAIGIFNSGSNVGAILTPLLVPVLVVSWGWQGAFFVTGGLGLIWVILAAFFFHTPESSPYVSASERSLIISEREPPLAGRGWGHVIKMRGTWGFAAAKFLTDPIWWFYLYWAPKYFTSQFGVELAGLAAPLVFVYLMADVGSIGGGWWSARLMKRGMTAARARTRVMLWCAISVLVVVFASTASSLWVATGLLGVATAAHQAWSANLFATVSDRFPRESVGSVVGFGGMMGAIGGMCIATLTGFILEHTGSYVILFCICSSAYLVAWFIFRACTVDDGREVQ